MVEHTLNHAGDPWPLYRLDGWVGNHAFYFKNLHNIDDGPIGVDYPIGLAYSGPRLFFTQGPARCGKSTFAERWKDGLECLEIPLTRRVVWNSDNLRLAMGGKRFSRTLEPQIHVFKSYAIKSLLLGGYTVLVDGTHTTRRSIRELLMIDIDAKPITFTTSKEECIRRAHATDQPDLVPVIGRHSDQLAELLAVGMDVVMEELRREVRDHEEYRWSKA